MQLFDFGELIPLVVVGGLIICVPLFFGGLVVIGEREVGIVVKKFARSPDIPTRLSPLPLALRGIFWRVAVGIRRLNCGIFRQV